MTMTMTEGDMIGEEEEGDGGGRGEVKKQQVGLEVSIYPPYFFQNMLGFQNKNGAGLIKGQDGGTERRWIWGRSLITSDCN